MVMSGQAS